MPKKREEYVALSHNRIGVPLTKGKMAIIDAADFDVISGRRWQASPGCTGKTFYARASIYFDGKRKTVTMHSLLMPKRQGFNVDHIDGDGLNNCRSNLRYATHAGQQQNRAGYPNTKSGYKNVFPKNSKGKKWRSSIRCEGKFIHLGYFDCPIEAAKAADAAAIKYHGEFARLNFPAKGVVNVREG